MGLDNLLTFGGKDKLEREQLELNVLIENYNKIGNEYRLVLFSRESLLNKLNEERFEAERNFALMTSLIEVVKNTIREVQIEINDDDLFNANEHTALNKIFVMETIDSEKIFSESFKFMFEASNDSMNRIFTNISENGSIGKKELKGELVGLGVTALASGLSYVTNLNEEINKRRDKIKEIRQKVQGGIDNIYNSYREVYQDSLRANELFTVLNKNNEVFLSIYLSVLEKYFIDMDFLKLKDMTKEQLVKNKDFINSLQTMISICQQYSKVKSVTITREN